MNLKNALILIVTFFLTACSTFNNPLDIFKSSVPVIETSQVPDANQPIEQFTIKAKFAYSRDSKGGSGRLIWRYENNQDEIDIFSPFNNQIAKIIYAPNEKKIIDTNGKILSGNDFDQYIESLFGKNIQPDLFRHLITNNVERIKDLRKEDNGVNRTTHFYNNEWNIVIDAFKTQDNLTIPSKISLTHDTFSFNFILEEIISIAGK